MDSLLGGFCKYGVYLGKRVGLSDYNRLDIGDALLREISAKVNIGIFCRNFVKRHGVVCGGGITQFLA